MKTKILGPLAGATAVALLTFCAPPGDEHVYPACDPAGAVFTVKLPVNVLERDAKICQPKPPQRLDALIPPVQPGSGAATQTVQCNAMGGIQILALPGDEAGYLRCRTVVPNLVPIVG